MFKSIKNRMIFLILLTVIITLLLYLFLFINIYHFEQIKYTNSSFPYYVLEGRNSNNEFVITRFIDYGQITQNSSNIIFANALLIAIPLLIIFLVLVYFFSKFIYKHIIENEFYQNNLKEVSNFNNEIKIQKNESLKTIHGLNNINQFTAHEIKNSLSILKGKLLLENSNSLTYIDTISKQVDDIRALTTQTLISPQKLDFLLLCAEIIDLFSNKIIDLDFESETEYFINGNKSLLNSALSNIIENAFKYGATKVTIKIKKVEHNIICIISNNGIQIEDKDLDKIFNLNYRSSLNNSDGSGIGLALVNNVIDLHLGSIYVESQKQITTFIISLPDAKVA